jgi:hypothetical protein
VIKLFRLPEISDIEHDVTECAVSNIHKEALINNGSRLLSRRRRFDCSIQLTMLS